MANSDVKLKRKVTLRRKVEEPIDEKPIGKPAVRSTQKTPKSKRWIWVLVGIIVLFLIGYFIFTRLGNDGEVPREVEETTVSHPKEAIENALDDDEPKDTDPKFSDESNTDVDEPETPVATEQPEPTPSADTSVRASSVSNDIEAEAMKVIRGDYGIGQERKNKLGEHYQAIQNRVNELKREGVF